MIKKVSAVLLAIMLCISAIVIPVSAAVELGSAKMAFSIEWDKESYNPGDTAVLSIYMDADDELSLATGSFVVALNSAQISQTDNDLETIRENTTIDDTFLSFYKDQTTQISWLAATVAPKVTAANTAEEQALYDHYVKFTGAKNSGGWHENTGTNKAGFNGTDFDPTVPVMTMAFTVSADAEVGTTLVAAITSGSKTCSPVQTSWKYYKSPGTATTLGTLTAAEIDVTQAVATAAIGEVAEHVCTPAEAVQENVIPATCGADGSHDDVVYCSSCGKELSRTPVVDKSTGDHVYATVVKEVPATCTEDGSVTKACGCGAEETTAVPATGHTETKAVTRPTCTEGGYTTYTCKTCGNTRTADETPAKGHDYREKVTAPTCTEAGYTTFTCPFCKDSYTGNPVEATGHNYESVVTAPTCTEDGYTTYTCSVCSDTYTSDVVPATGHTYEVTAVKQPTCSKDGFTRYTCACGDTYDEPIPTTNHTNPDGTSALVEIPAVPATCKTEGKTAGQKCSICNSVVVSPETVEKLPHAWVAGEVVAPTYNEQGYTTYTCSVCSDTKKDDYTDKLVGVEVEIEAPESTQVNEGESVTLKAPVTAEGFRVEWTADNANFTMTQNEDGSVTLTPAANGDSVITVTVYDADGNEVSSDSIVMTAVVEDAGDDDGEEEPWWKKLINWIISLFKKLVEIIVNLVSSLVS